MEEVAFLGVATAFFGVGVGLVFLVTAAGGEEGSTSVGAWFSSSFSSAEVIGGYLVSFVGRTIESELQLPFWTSWP